MGMISQGIQEVLSRVAEETHGVTKTSLPSLNGNDGLSRLDEAESKTLLETESDSVVDVGLPLLGGDASGLLVEEGVASSVEVDLSRGGGRSGDGEDGDLRSVLGKESGGRSRGREDEDGSSVLLGGGGDGGDLAKGAAKSHVSDGRHTLEVADSRRGSRRSQWGGG